MTPFSRGKRVSAPARRKLLSLAIITFLLTATLVQPFIPIRLSVKVSAAGSISLTTLGTAYTQDFNTLANAGTSSTVPNGWDFTETGTNANTTYSASDGTGMGTGTPPSISGDTYSFGSTGSTERAFGGILSGSLTPTTGAIFVNNTGGTITSVDISYTGEQWRLGTAGRAVPDRIDFQYSTTATAINSGTFTDENALDFVTPNPGAAAGPLDGNAAANRTAISATISGLSIPNGGTLVIRWLDFNASGADDGLSVDDFSLTPNGSGGGGPSNPSGIGGANPATVIPGGSSLLTVTVTPGANPPSTNLAVTANLSSIGGSATQQFFDDGTNGDQDPGDNIFSYQATVTMSTTLGTKTLPFTITDAEARTGTGNITLNIQSASGMTPINAIQGSVCNTPNCVTVSPFDGQIVTTQGIVTGLRSNGYFIQTPDAQVDSDPNTSEGILVFTSSTPPAAAAVGNLVNVTGTVDEFSPNADPNSPPETEIVGSTVNLVTTGNPLPAPITITAADTNPNGGFEQLEKYEGMRVHIESLTVCAPTAGSVNEANATSTSTGVFYGVITGIPRPFLEPGIRVPNPVPTPHPSGAAPANVPRFDNNPERIRIDSDVQPGSSAINVATGAIVTNITGPLDYAFRAYTILPDPTPAPTVINPGLTNAIPVPAQTANEFTVGAWNMERFFDTTDDSGISDVALTTTAFNNRLNKASLAIRNILRSPDILGVEEIENLTTLQAIATKINNDTVAATGTNPNYQAFLVEGNDIGGIDVGFLVKTSRVAVVDVTQFGKTTTYTEPGGGSALLNDRPPLVLRANVTRPDSGLLPVTVIVNHLRSLNGIDGTDGARIRAKRAAQAEYLANLIQARQVADPTENIIVVGDFNAFQFNDGYVDLIGTIKGRPTPPDQVVLASPDLVNPDLINLIDTLPRETRYTYTFDGNAQVLDHALINRNLALIFNRFAVAHHDADFPDSLRSDPNRPERLSDHDAPVAYFDLVKTPRQKTRADFDGDKTTDVSVFRSSDGLWSAINSGGNPPTSQQWGDSNDRLVPGDYDGDFRTDVAVYRPSEGNWYIIKSSDGTVLLKNWGESGDIPVPGDYDGDFKTDLAVWRPSEGNWYILSSINGSASIKGWGAGSLGDVPVPGDYDGDSRTDMAVWRAGEGNWYILNSSGNTVTVQGWGAGGLGDKPVPADYNGDGRTDIGVFRPFEGNWYILNSNGGGVTVRNWGTSTDKLVPGDYDGDGRADLAVFRSSEGNWYIIGSASGNIIILSSGDLGDVPIPSVLIPQ